MKKMLATFVASTFVFASISGFAADAAKKEELTQEQRIEMRNRAEKMKQDRAQTATQTKTDAQPATKAKTQ